MKLRSVVLMLLASGAFFACQPEKTPEQLAKETCDCLDKRTTEQQEMINQTTEQNRSLPAAEQIEKFAEAIKRAEEQSIDVCIAEMKSNPAWASIEANEESSQAYTTLVEACAEPKRTEFKSKLENLKNDLKSSMETAVDSTGKAIENLGKKIQGPAH